ncbi:hypothetical protein HW115_10455 [Verrucomicrobiaceae bacterium N1E253]|uniref:Archaemetzincin n=1 Tax=Oceaniferula marina TaxID=2748318 RepID=A0A851GER6_9BACT|nr:archaemetzincin [Oceaniferula marina]NWK56033.1 hypothetical protein [Oceaniferula marina]
MNRTNIGILGLAVLCSLLVIVFTSMVAAEFQVPDASTRKAAVGSLRGLDHEMRVAFGDDRSFASFPEPGFNDWVSQHPEKGQTYRQYSGSRYNKINQQRRVLYIQPLGEFDERLSPSLEALRDFTAAYYYPMKVVVLPARLPGKVTSRQNGDFKQWLTGDVLDDLQARIPNNAYSLLGVTMTDLYPDESWNFVFGQARYRARVGVFSFARYLPQSGDEGSVMGEEQNRVLLKRAAKVLTHETGHMFGVRHCIYYHCNMNGANHLQEADAAPMHLCPVCLRKLHRVIGFSPLSRYKKLNAFYVKHGMTEDARWVQSRLEQMKKKQ